MQISKFIATVLLLIITSIQSGCGTLQMYKGERLPREEVALIYEHIPPMQIGWLVMGTVTMPLGLLLMQIPSAFGEQDTSAVKIDNQEISFWMSAWNSAFEVKPGYHTVRLQYRWNVEECVFLCKPGGTYVLHSTNSEPAHGWVVDYETGEIVATGRPVNENSFD